MSKIKNSIVKILKDLELFEYYNNKDVDKENDESSIYIIDLIVLQDDIEYILKNQDEYCDEDSVYYNDEVEFINKIKELKKRLDKLTSS